MDENSFLQTGHNVRKTVRIGLCTALPGESFQCGVWSRATEDPTCAGRLEIMVRVSTQGHTKSTDRQTSSPS